MLAVDQIARRAAPPLSAQISQARARYAEALDQLNEATAFYERNIPQGDGLRDLIPDERERALTVRKAIEDCAYWDAEVSAAEIRLARLARIALKFSSVGEPAP